MRIQILCIFLLLAIASQKLSAASSPIDGPTEKGYALGWQLGRIVKNNHPFIRFSKVTSGMTDSLLGNPAQLSQERIDTLTKELAKEERSTIDEQKKMRLLDQTTPQKSQPDDDALGYALGWRLGQTVKTRHPSLNLKATPSGLDDALKGKIPQVPPERIDALLKELSKQSALSPEEQKKRSEQKRASQAKQNEKEGIAFLVKNKHEKGVITTSSGLQYAVLRQGKGPIPKQDSYVSLDYRGTFLDGREFDTTYKRGRPYEGYVDKAIPGWKEILQIMPVGSKYRIFLPPNLAFADEGYGPIVGPNASLIYEIELLSIHNNLPQQPTSPVSGVFSQIDLSNPDKSAASFIKLYTAISPQYTQDDLLAICQTIAAESFQKTCTDTLTKRLTLLQGMKGLEKAFFTDKKTHTIEGSPNTVGVSWQEQLTLADAQTITTLESMLLHFKKVNFLWKIDKITQSDAANIPASDK